MVEIYILKSENEIDGCQSFTHVSLLIETKEKNKENSQLNKLDSHYWCFYCPGHPNIASQVCPEFWLGVDVVYPDATLLADF